MQPIIIYVLLFCNLFVLVPSLPPPVVVAHGTSYSSVMVTWAAIPESHTNGIIQGYVAMLDDINERFYGCDQIMKIEGLEKSKAYKIKVAGFTSGGLGNFSDDVIAITNINGGSLSLRSPAFSYRLQTFKQMEFTLQLNIYY